MTLRDHWRKNYRGNVVPICTSFNSDYSLNTKMVRKHIRYIIDHGITSEYGLLLVGAAAGEHPSMSFDERQELLESALEEAAGGIPIFFGATGTHTAEAIKLTQMAEKLGVAGIQMSMPYYEVPTFEDTKAFYREINDSTGLGMTVYNTFASGGSEMSDFRLAEFLVSLPQICGLKWNTLSGYQYDLVYKEFAEQIPMYDNQLHEVYGIMMGAIGFTSHIPVFWPEYGVKLWDLLKQKQYVQAMDLANRVRVPYYRLILEGAEFSAGDGIIERVACRLMNLEVGPSRKPIQPCPPEIADRIKAHLIEIGALDAAGQPTNQ